MKKIDLTKKKWVTQSTTESKKKDEIIGLCLVAANICWTERHLVTNFMKRNWHFLNFEKKMFLWRPATKNKFEKDQKKIDNIFTERTQFFKMKK